MTKWRLGLQVTLPSGGQQAQRAGDGESSHPVTEVLENTLWNRQLGVMSEEIVAALVCQIFEGAWRRLGLGLGFWFRFRV